VLKRRIEAELDRFEKFQLGESKEPARLFPVTED
jgi:hypothetical protein